LEPFIGVFAPLHCALKCSLQCLNKILYDMNVQDFIKVCACFN